MGTDDCTARAGVTGHHLLAFFTLTFILSWSCWLVAGQGEGTVAGVLAVVGRFGPSVSAVAVVALSGPESIRSFLTDRLRWRGLSRYWLVAFAGPPAVVLTSLALVSLMGEELGSFNDLSTLYLVVPAFAVIFVLGGPMGEEVGWRGFVLDPLQDRLGPVGASLVLGMVWGAWHLPLFADPDQIQHGLSLPIYFGQTTATAFVYTWLWNRSMSLPLVMSFHASTNVSAGAFPLLVPEAVSQVPFMIAVILATAVAVGLSIATGGQLGCGTTARGRSISDRVSQTRP